MTHRLQPVGAQPLHPNQVVIVAAATARGLYAGVCTCGTILTGNNDLDLFCNYKDHRAAAAHVANGGGVA
jgi:lipid-binding SYLF domain-containing protein